MEYVKIKFVELDILSLDNLVRNIEFDIFHEVFDQISGSPSSYNVVEGVTEWQIQCAEYESEKFLKYYEERGYKLMICKWEYYKQQCSSCGGTGRCRCCDGSGIEEKRK